MLATIQVQTENNSVWGQVSIPVELGERLVVQAFRAGCTVAEYLQQVIATTVPNHMSSEAPAQQPEPTVSGAKPSATIANGGRSSTAALIAMRPRIFRLRDQGFTHIQIAQACGIGVATVSRSLAGRPAGRPVATPSGKKMTSPVYVKSLRPQMAAMRNQGCTYKEISAEFGIDKGTVARAFAAMAREAQAARGKKVKEAPEARPAILAAS